jgi:hypothetical protein
MTAEACAAASLRPLPCETANVLEFGRMAIHTGMPTRSSPVTSASRVMPNRPNSGRIRATVSEADRNRSELGSALP